MKQKIIKFNKRNILSRIRKHFRRVFLKNFFLATAKLPIGSRKNENNSRYFHMLMLLH